jgi:hypothetical protein
MTQPALPTDKTFHMAVELVSTDGKKLPFKGFVLIPEDRWVLIEKLAAAAQDVVARNRDAFQNPTRNVQTAVLALDNVVSELEKVWDIPQTAPKVP